MYNEQLMIYMESEEGGVIDRGKTLAAVALAKIKEEDIIHRGFLKPIEIALKTHKTEMNSQHIEAFHMDNEHHFLTDEDADPKLKINSLPSGLKIVVKNCIADNKFTLRDVIMLEDEPSYQQLKVYNQDNILSLMKVKEGIEIAICICMYSEDKKMLKSTLAGVSQNISNLVIRERIDPDKIGVFVIMDGIEKVDESVVQYFEELERSNCINLGDNIPVSMSIEEMARRTDAMTEDEINEQEFKNVNSFLFDVAELQDRNQRRFSCIKNEYEEIKVLLNKIQQLKKKKATFDDLPSKVRPFFFSQARIVRKKMFSMSEEEVNEISQEKLIEQFAIDVRKAKPIIIKALQECERYCKEFTQSREDLAYLACFRNQIHIVQQQEKAEEEATQKKKKRERKLSMNTIIDTTTVIHDDQIQVEELQTSMNLFLCVKYKNSGKLSSHNWFFNGFCKELQPKYAVLLDVGLKPQSESLYKMYKYMKTHERIGGVCGYMSLKIEQLEEQEEQRFQDIDCLSKIMLKVADIQRTQQVEYHFAHLMDKAFEASFGFIHVLPGAFSAYNMKAILKYDSTDDDQLLKSYFKSIDEKIANTKIVKTKLTPSTILLRILFPDFINRCFLDISPQSQQQMLYNQNIYLAEDRILCMGIHKKGFDIAFIPDAYAEVDPIKTVHGLLGQRKRWINGSFFAFQKVKKQLGEHQKRAGCEFLLNLQILYLTIMNSLSYFAPSLFLFTVHIAMDAFRADVLTNVLVGVIKNPNDNELFKSFVYTADFIYVMLILSVVYYSLHLTNSNKHFKPYIYAISTIFGLFSISVFIVLAVDVFRGLINESAFLIQNQALVQSLPGGYDTINAMRWILIGSTLIYALPILIYVILFKNLHILCEVIMGSFSFLFYGPTYLNILNIYSLCRVDDISWGTKGLEAGSSKDTGLKNSWYLIKYIHVSKFMIWNIVVGVILLMAGADYKPRFFITIIMVSLMALTLSVKIIIAIFYMIGYKIKNCEDEGMKVAPVRTMGLSRIESLFAHYYESILDEVRNHLLILAEKYNKSDFRDGGRSFLQLARTYTHVEKSFKKRKEDFLERSQMASNEGRTEKDLTTVNREYNNQAFNLPIQTKNALDHMSSMGENIGDKKVSLDEKMENPSESVDHSLQQMVGSEHIQKLSSKLTSKLSKRSSNAQLPPLPTPFSRFRVQKQ